MKKVSVYLVFGGALILYNCFGWSKYTPKADGKAKTGGGTVVPSAEAQRRARIEKIKAASAANKARVEQASALSAKEQAAIAAAVEQKLRAEEEKRKSDAAAAAQKRKEDEEKRKKDTAASAQPWNCSACTYQNAAARTVCEMCGAKKPVAVVEEKKGGTEGSDEKKQSKEEAAALEKLRKEMTQLVARQSSLQKDLESARSSEEEAKKKGETLSLSAPLQTQLNDLTTQIKQKQEEIDKRTGTVVSSAAQPPAMTKEELELQKAMAESAEEAGKRAVAAKTSQEALAKAAEAAKQAASRSALVPVVPLVNVGATCFANATLQCLFQLPLLQSNVFSLGDSKDWQAAHPRVSRQSIDHIAQYQQMVIALQGWNPATAFTPAAFCTAMRTRVFGGVGGMQDAAQFFGAFADDLREMSGKTPFDVSIKSTIVCHECKQSSVKTDTEHFLALSIAGGTLKECLTQYMQGEELKGANQYRCGYCNVKRDATKTLKVVSLPEVLVLQFKRYTGTVTITKITAAVSFPLVLGQEDFYQGDEKAAGVVYDLVGMVNHNGSFAGGHYTSYVKSSGDGKWHFCDDAAIKEQTVEQVSAVAGAGVDAGYRGATPYLLFYLRRHEAKASSAS